MDRYILDACALLTFFNDEEGAEIVEGLLQKAESMEISVRMSIINLLEVYYDRLRTRKDSEIKDFLEFTAVAPIEILNSISDFVFHEAARLKASYKMSLADAVGLAATKELSGQFVTSDHSELEEVEQHEKIPFLWLPAKPKKP
jgi:predicted nucleic acid-binding protein